jgi:hypothetical protein
MNFERKFTLFMAGFMVVSIAYLFIKTPENSTVASTVAAAEQKQSQIIAYAYDPKTTGSMASGDAVIELSPKRVDKSTLEVSFNINSHSVGLSGFNLKEIAVLEHGEHVFMPVRAGRVGGHHSAGVIVFDVGDKVSNKDSIKIRLHGIPKLQERIYEWDEV